MLKCSVMINKFILLISEMFSNIMEENILTKASIVLKKCSNRLLDNHFLQRRIPMAENCKKSQFKNFRKLISGCFHSNSSSRTRLLSLLNMFLTIKHIPDTPFGQTSLPTEPTCTQIHFPAFWRMLPAGWYLAPYRLDWQAGLTKWGIRDVFYR